MRTRLKKAGVLVGGASVVATAKVPIIKATLRPGWRSLKRISADISLGVENGVRTVAFVQAQLQALPPLRPLLLVLKASLQQHELDNAATGGLSSYSLLNMVRLFLVEFLTLLHRATALHIS